MKLYSFILVILIAVSYNFIGCDSVSDSKPVSTTPPSLLSPADRDSNISVTPTFTWSGTADKLEIATNPAFGSSVIHSVGVQGTSYTMPTQLDHGKYYYWHAGRTSGSVVYWSTNYYTFKTIP